MRAERTTILSVWLDKPDTLNKEISFLKRSLQRNFIEMYFIYGRGDAIAFYMLFNKLNYNIKFYASRWKLLPALAVKVNYPDSSAG